MISMLGTGKEFGCLKFLLFSDPLAASVLCTSHRRCETKTSFLQTGGIGRLGRGKIAHLFQGEGKAKGRGKVTDESLIGLVLCACNLSQLIKEH